tara:strand:+ start:10594 stop:12174 length:1581 start_codon:yes stop_codon:yes gene_type:complete
MSVDAKHPLYGEFVVDWSQMRDTYRGQRVVKAAGAAYLPPTSGMVQDGTQTTESKGFKAYDSYKKRAVFPDLLRAAVESMLGVMHARPPVIELPAAMESMLEDATLKHESLEMLLRRINEEQLITGRLGLLAEVPPGEGATMPFIAMYRAEDVINWDEGTRTGTEVDSLNFVALNESEFERQPGDFEWEFVNKYRVLILGDPDVNEPQGEGVYRVGVFSEQGSVDDERAGTGLTFTEEALETPVVAGKTSEKIPFVFVNAKDIVPDPEEPPLLGLSNLALTIYRGEADYRQALFMQGQDTLVVIGHQGGENSPEHRIGAGASIDLPMGGEALFIGVDSQGLPEMRTAIENDHTRAGKKAGEFIDETSRSRESGEALKVRVAARTATLNGVALAGAFALQELLRTIAVWVGANPEEVLVTPNTDFVDDRMSGQELAQLMGSKTMGAPLSLQSIHALMQDRNVTEKTWEEELAALEEEDGIEVLTPAGTDDEDGPEDDEEELDENGDPIEKDDDEGEEEEDDDEDDKS